MKNSSKKPILIIVIFWALIIGGITFYTLSPYLLSSATKEPIDDIKYSPFHDICVSKMAKKGNEFLSPLGYVEQLDGSFIDNQGKYPTREIIEDERLFLRNFFSDCIEKQEKTINKTNNFQIMLDPTFGFIFDHSHDMALGGSDFKTVTEEQVIQELQELSSYNDSYKSCFYKAIDEESKILIRAYEYERQEDGTWRDNNGFGPSVDLETEIEFRVTELFINCVD